MRNPMLQNQVKRFVACYYLVKAEGRDNELFVDVEFEAAQEYYSVCEEKGLNPSWEELLIH